MMHEEGNDDCGCAHCAGDEGYELGIAYARASLASLITEGHNMRLLLKRIAAAHEKRDDEALVELLGSIPRYDHEWEKRAKRAEVDWWNR